MWYGILVTHSSCAKYHTKHKLPLPSNPVFYISYMQTLIAAAHINRQLGTALNVSIRVADS